MITIDVNGGKKKERELMISLADFCVKKLMPRKKNLDVNISIKRNMIEDEGMFAGVIDTDDTNTFDMDIDSSMSLRKKLLSVAHEMVHVKQFTRGELKHTNRYTKKLWYGKAISEANYWECPWEIEAYGRELGLFTMWIEENKIKGNFTEEPI
jgi:hypothetical protein